MTPGQEEQAAPWVSISADFGPLLARLAEAPEIVNAEIAAFLEETGQAGTRIAQEETPEGALGGSGGLRGSVAHQVRGAPARELMIGWSAPHGEYVARGRRPGGWPPAAPIELWIRRSPKGQAMGVPEDKIASVAFLIRRAIAKRGTRGDPFDVRTMHRLDPVIGQLVEKYAERIAGRLSER